MTQAERNDVIEECARAAEETGERFIRGAGESDAKHHIEIVVQGCTHAAAEIRALKWKSFS